MDPRDRMGQGEPETVVLLPNGDALIGLLVPGVLCDLVLWIREDRVGAPVSCAVVNALRIDTSQPDRRQGGIA